MSGRAPVLRLSVAVVVHKTSLPMLRDNLTRLLSAFEFLNKTIPSLTSIYVIDNSLCDKYHGDLLVDLESVKLPTGASISPIKLGSNSGYGHANNQIFKFVQSEYHLVMNPDVGLKRDALVESVRFMDGAQDAVLLTPQVVGAKGEVKHVSKTYPDCFTLFLRYLNIPWLRKFFSGRLSRYSLGCISESKVHEVEVAGGCFMFLRTESFLSIGGFDKRFFMYFEDFDLSLRVKKMGRIYYVSNVKISHEGGDVGRKNIKHHIYFMVSAFKFFSKHGWRLV